MLAGRMEVQALPLLHSVTHRFCLPANNLGWLNLVSFFMMLPVGHSLLSWPHVPCWYPICGIGEDGHKGRHVKHR